MIESSDINYRVPRSKKIELMYKGLCVVRPNKKEKKKLSQNSEFRIIK